MLLLHYTTTTTYQSFIADEDEALYSNLLPGKILFGQGCVSMSN